jgi:hypothetical protein
VDAAVTAEDETTAMSETGGDEESEASEAEDVVCWGMVEMGKEERDEACSVELGVLTEAVAIGAS